MVKSRRRPFRPLGHYAKLSDIDFWAHLSRRGITLPIKHLVHIIDLEGNLSYAQLTHLFEGMVWHNMGDDFLVTFNGFEAVFNAQGDIVVQWHQPN